jgi:hypothetical protein
MSLTAIHIRTGEASLNRTVEGWLEQHKVPAQSFADAYEACVHLIGHAAAVPDFAFVGADWLTPEEWPIVRYLHDTWPGVAIIVYASRRVAGLPEPVGSRAVCTSARVLDRMLELGPDNLLRSMRTSPAGDLIAAKPREPVGPPVLEHAVAAASAKPAGEVGGNGAQSTALAGDLQRNNGGGEAPGGAPHPELWLLTGEDD